MTELAGSWAAAVRAGGASAGAAAVASAGAALVESWSAAHRHYHGLEHLTEVLAAVEELAGEADHPEVVRLAAWFHDAVYEGRPSVDERDSAQLAREVLAALGIAAEVAEAVARLVLMTADHDPRPGDRDAAVLCDADLAILGAAPQRYERYVEAVRREYAAVPEAMFRSGRAAVLRALAAAPALYRTQPARERWEAAARTNVAAELTRLES